MVALPYSGYASPRRPVAVCPRCGGPAPFNRGWGRFWCSACHAEGQRFGEKPAAPTVRRRKRQHTGHNPR